MEPFFQQMLCAELIFWSKFAIFRIPESFVYMNTWCLPGVKTSPNLTRNLSGNVFFFFLTQSLIQCRKKIKNKTQGPFILNRAEIAAWRSAVSHLYAGV